MRRAVLALALLLTAAGSFAEARKDLSLRSRLLLKAIRDQAASPTKDVERLRSQLSALKAENGAEPDQEVTAQLQAAESNIQLIEAGQALPPPAPEDEVSDEDLRDSVAQPPVQPPAPPPAPVIREAAPAVVPETAAPVFDGSLRRSGSASPAAASAPAVQTPPAENESNLDHYLELTNTGDQSRFLVTASKSLLETLHVPDKDGMRANALAAGIHSKVSTHPKRADFISLRLKTRKDKKVHLVYRVRNGGAVDEELGDLDEMSTPHTGRSGNPPPKRKGKKKGSKGGAAGGGDDDGGGGGGGHGKRGRGGRKGRGGGGGGGGGDGGGAGPGGSGKSSHARAPRAKGGAGMFDGGGDGGDGGAGGGSDGMFSGKGSRGRGRKGRHGGAAGSGGGEGGDADGSASSGSFGSGRSHAGAGGSMSADAPGASRSRGKGAFVPLPRDFTTRGGGSRLRGEGSEGGSGPSGAGLGGFHMSGLAKKDFHHDAHDAPAKGAAAAVPAPRDSFAQAPAATAAPASASAAPAAGSSPLSMSVGRDEDLKDAVAGNAVTAPAKAVPQTALSPLAPAEPAPEQPSPLLAAVTAAGAIGLGAFAFRRLRRPKG